MENASKALIIAGAILISILLISVGVLIMNSTNGVTSGMGGSARAMEMQTFNSQFVSYGGDAVSSSQVRSLVSSVITSNAENENHPVLVATKGPGFKAGTSLYNSGTSDAANLAKINQGLKSTYRFKVSLEYDEDGFINKITIE